MNIFRITISLKTELSRAISSLCDSLTISPDQLYKKSNCDYKIDWNKMERDFDKDLDQIKIVVNQHIHGHFNYNDRYVCMRRILANPDEFCEEDSGLKRLLAHIYICHDVFRDRIYRLENLMVTFGKLSPNTKEYYRKYVIIQNVLSHLQQLVDDYQRYIDRINLEISGDRGPWHIKLPEPYRILRFINEALINLKDGDLSFSVLRSYIEIRLSIILENTINNELRHINSSKYDNKKILFQRNMEFTDIIRLLECLGMLPPNDINIICRIHDFASQSIHRGSFFDQAVTLYLLFYLENVSVSSHSSHKSILDITNEFVKIRKFRVISRSDNWSDYSRFQATSNQRNSGSKI